MKKPRWYIGATASIPGTISDVAGERIPMLGFKPDCSTPYLFGTLWFKSNLDHVEAMKLLHKRIILTMVLTEDLTNAD